MWRKFISMFPLFHISSHPFPLPTLLRLSTLLSLPDGAAPLPQGRHLPQAPASAPRFPPSSLLPSPPPSLHCYYRTQSGREVEEWRERRKDRDASWLTRRRRRGRKGGREGGWVRGRWRREGSLRRLGGGIRGGGRRELVYLKKEWRREMRPGIRKNSHEKEMHNDKSGKGGKEGRSLHTYIFFHFLFFLLSGGSRTTHKGGINAAAAEEEGEERRDLGRRGGKCSVAIRYVAIISFQHFLPSFLFSFASLTLFSLAATAFRFTRSRHTLLTPSSPASRTHPPSGEGKRKCLGKEKRKGGERSVNDC